MTTVLLIFVLVEFAVLVVLAGFLLGLCRTASEHEDRLDDHAQAMNIISRTVAHRLRLQELIREELH